LNSLFHLILFI